MTYLKQNKKVAKAEKQILGIFLFIGVITLVFGFLQLKRNLEDPFLALHTDYNKETQAQQRTKELLALKTKDSDLDGLSDYDELFQYETSPYIADSDSDGFSDNEEIKSGNDPNCPEGKECVRSQIIPGETSQEVDIANIAPSQLREILLQNGVPQSTLNSLDDETLMNFYREVIGDTATVNKENTSNTNDRFADLLYENVNSTEAITEQAITAGDLAELSADEIRALLLATGEFTEETLNSITDEELKAVFQKVLQEQKIIE